MSTPADFLEFVCEHIDFFDNVRYRKMFGEGMVYVNDKPVLLVCDSIVYVKEIPELADLLANAERGIPYDGAKEHYVLDIENHDLAKEAITILELTTPLPKPKKRKESQKTTKAPETIDESAKVC